MHTSAILDTLAQRTSSPCLFALLVSAAIAAFALPARAQGGCESDQECRAGRRCIEGSCTSAVSCARDIDCPGDLVCTSGTCTALETSGPGGGTTVIIESAPPPPPASSINEGLTIGGFTMLGVGWFLEWLVTLVVDYRGSEIGSSFIPVVGPWIQLGVDDGNVDDEGFYPALVIDGLLQAAGLTLGILGLLGVGNSPPASVSVVPIGTHGAALTVRGALSL